MRLQHLLNSVLILLVQAWMWFYNVVGKQRCPIVDTWWQVRSCRARLPSSLLPLPLCCARSCDSSQTETGAVMLAPFPGAVPTKPGCATVPFFGVQPAVVDEQGQPVPQGETGYLVVEQVRARAADLARDGRFTVVQRAQAWPGMMRTVYNNHERFVQVRHALRAGRLVRAALFVLSRYARTDKDVPFALPRQVLHGGRRTRGRGRLLVDHWFVQCKLPHSATASHCPTQAAWMMC